MRFPSQAQKKHGNSVFKQKILALFSRGSHHKPKKREIPFSNRRYWHYFPEKPTKTRKSRFQMRFPSQAQKKYGNSVFKQKILILFSRGCHHKPKKREIPFSNRRYWHYFPEVPSTSPKKGNPVFKQKILALCSQIRKTRLADKPFSNRRYCQTTNGEAEKTISNRRYSLYAHVFTHIYSKFSKQDWPTNHFQIEDIVKQPMGKRKRQFQIEDNHYTNRKFSEQDCATNHFLNRRYSVG